MIASTDISEGLQTERFGRKLFVFDTIDSTNSCARLLAECGVEEGTVVYADEQTSGRGRMKRKWITEKEKNLLFSIVFAPEIKERRYYLIPLLVSICIIDSINKNVPESKAILKWPNDILLENGKKIGGILTELTRTFDNLLRIVVGVGLNVNQTSFPPDISSTASSLHIAAGRHLDRFALFRSILTAIEERYPSVLSDPESIVERWRAHCTMFGKPVRVQQGTTVQTGICKDIDREGALLIEKNNGNVIRIIAGDVVSVAVNSQ